MKRGGYAKKILLAAGCLAFTFMLSKPIDAEAAWSKNANSQWVYYDDEGNLLKDRWVGNYYVGSDGIMYTNAWVHSESGTWFVGENGKWIPNFNGGWKKISGKWYLYTAKGEKLTGWQQVDGKWYYMNESGAMLSGGWKNMDGTWYYFDSSGKAACDSWKKIKGKWYYFDSKCRMQTGFIHEGGKQYYCNDNGTMLTGWKIIDGTYYYMNGSGVIQTNKWVKSGGRWYYLQADGKMAANGWVTDKGKTYYCNASGVMLTGWQIIDGHYYYFNGSGTMLANQWQRSGSKWYYLQADGKMATGFIEVDGNTYYCNGSGAMQTGWELIDGIYYYFNGSGVMQTNQWKRSNGLWYYLQDNGMMASGFVNADGYLYYCDSSGVMQTGFKEIQGSIYYFEETARPAGHARVNDWKSNNGYWYYFGGDGRAVTGLQNIGASIFYFNESGVMQTNGSVTVGGVKYLIASDGKCTKANGITTNKGTKDDFLFFTQYESGKNYGQTLGDYGNAFGFYQFDYRYSLQPLLNYCYSKDPVIFAKFEPFLKIDKNKLKGNLQLKEAWEQIYATNPNEFAACQDEYAENTYYLPVERGLKYSYGIDISGRTNVIKGAVFSTSIQHGSGTATEMIKAAGITNATSDYEFITLLYNYRSKVFPPYSSRYSMEGQDALRRLALLGA